MKSNLQLTSNDVTRHSVYNLNYKIVFKISNDNAVNQRASYLFKQSAKRLGSSNQVLVTGWKSKRNLIAMRIHCQSMLRIQQFAEKFKQISSSDYHHIINPNDHQPIWCPGYCLITVSSHSKQTVQKYLSK